MKSRFSKRVTRRVRNCDPTINSPTRNLCHFSITLLMYTVASPDPDPEGEGQLPDPNECNSTLTSATREEMLAPNPNECNCTLTRGTRGIYPYPLYRVSHKKVSIKNFYSELLKASIYSF